MKNAALFAPLSMVVSLALIAAASAMPAQARDFDPVDAELGALPPPDVTKADGAVVFAAATGGQTRAQVVAELVRARDAGELDWAYVEAHQMRLEPRGIVRPGALQLARTRR